MEPTAPGTRVSRLELFYDLVFVYAFLNVTTAASRNLTLLTVLASFLLLTLLWLAWTTFAVIGNIVRTDQGVMPPISFAIVAAIFVIALTLPDAFRDEPRSLPGDLIFAWTYFLVRALEVLASWYVMRLRPPVHRWRLALTLPPVLATAMLLIAALVPQRIFEGRAEFAARLGLWAVAIAIAYLGGGIIRRRSLGIVSVNHWTERHAQIILVALGESIISLGLGPNLEAGLPLTGQIILASVLGVAVVAAFWWAYFDSISIEADYALRRRGGRERLALAQSGYTYLHLPMVFGIILVSLGLKRILAYLADPAVPRGQDVVEIDTNVLFAGAITFAFALACLRFLISRRVDWSLLGGGTLLAALIPVAHRLPVFGVLALLVLFTVGGMVVHSILNRGYRRQLRRRQLEEERALEAEEAKWRRRHV